MLFAQEFDEQFKDWAIDGYLSSAGFVVVVLVVVGLVLMLNRS